MMLHSYRKRLEADLVAWTAAGLIEPSQALGIRRAVAAKAGGSRLPALLGLLGGLLLASSVLAFVAANWALVPRIGKLSGILILIIAALATALHVDRKGARLASDAASTTATLIFGAGVALVGQMYHLPADWPAGTALVGIGALVVAALMRSDGALLIAFACMIAWLFGVHDETVSGVNLPYLAFFAPALALALGRSNRAVHHLAVLAALAWLVLLVGDNTLRAAELGTHIAYLLFVAVCFIGLGLLAAEGRLPVLFSACTAWGLMGYIVVIGLQLARVLEPSGAVAGFAAPRVIVAGLLGVGAVVALLALLPDRKSAGAMAAALVLAMATSLVFWSGAGQSFAGRVLVSALVLLSSSAMIVAGAVMAQRRVSLAGAGAFGLAVIVLLYRTVGTLLDQSLFFLVGGVLLIAIAVGMRRLLQRFGAPQPGGAP
ncbi:MAG: DUF2157 domain-containing protein [Beijerinckiaceae bacterium]|jgi:uncharacterized membrane protein|nr:DUF2157 domain-containing protein [Beijerinckiaceae bacterium]